MKLLIGGPRRTCASFVALVALAVTPHANAVNIVLDRLARPWVHEFTQNFGADPIDVSFKFEETFKLGSPPVTNFGAFTDRLGTLVTQKLRIESPVVEMSGSYIYSSRVFGSPALRHTLSIGYDLDAFGLPDLLTSGGFRLDCPLGCPAATSPLALKGRFSNPLTDVLLAAPGAGHSQIAMRFTSTVLQVPGASFESASKSVATVKIGIFREYQPKDTLTYVRDALIGVRDLSFRTDKEKADLAFKDVINLREIDEATSSQNTNLRDAEYFLRGYSGGRILYERSGGGRIEPGNDYFNSGGPIVASVYNVCKYLFNAGPCGSEGLPGTAPEAGSVKTNGLGWILGKAGVTISQIIDTPIADLLNGSPPPVTLSTDPMAPLAPSVTFNELLDAGTDFVLLQLALGAWDFVITEPVTYWFDPQPTKSYQISVFGNSLGLLRVLSKTADHRARILFGDREIEFDPEAGIDLSAVVPEGVSDLLLKDIDVDGAPAFGLRFVGTGHTSLVITEVTPVPEPSAWLMLLAGLAIVMLRRSKIQLSFGSSHEGIQRRDIGESVEVAVSRPEFAYLMPAAKCGDASVVNAWTYDTPSDEQ